MINEKDPDQQSNFTNRTGKRKKTKERKKNQDSSKESMASSMAWIQASNSVWEATEMVNSGTLDSSSENTEKQYFLVSCLVGATCMGRMSRILPLGREAWSSWK